MSEIALAPDLAPVAPWRPRTACQHCGSPLYPILDLGRLAPASFPRPEDPDPPSIPISLLVCEVCHFVQLGQIIDDEQLYRQYWYRSGINETMRAELADIVQQAKVITTGTTDKRLTVLDVGANDGTLLAEWGKEPFRAAFEPARNLHESLRPHADLICDTFFPGVESHAIPAHQFDVITTIAMFYDLEDPRSCVEEIDRLLTPKGAWIVQFQDLGQQVATTAFDNVCFEHRGYYSLHTFAHLLEGHDLHITEAQHRAINGGSLRLVVRRRSQKVRPSVSALHEWEKPYVTLDALERFAWRSGQVRTQIQEAIRGALVRGPIDLYAASTKSSTLLQYCGLDHTVIRQAVERTQEKVGRVTAGTRIPIVSEQYWREDPAPVTLVGAWQFAEAFVLREAEYLRSGGNFLVPLPFLRVISAGVDR